MLQVTAWLKFPAYGASTFWIWLRRRNQQLCYNWVARRFDGTAPCRRQLTTWDDWGWITLTDVPDGEYELRLLVPGQAPYPRKIWFQLQTRDEQQVVTILEDHWPVWPQLPALWDKLDRSLDQTQEPI